MTLDDNGRECTRCMYPYVYKSEEPCNSCDINNSNWISDAEVWVEMKKRLSTL